ncbi:hypothetical protein [Streptomyces sp. NPDC057682]|uniref:hypothetical protein n=1 Tax=unclassified Streptomyces TaxID=2593676 RepID=UPI0036683F88
MSISSIRGTTRRSARRHLPLALGAVCSVGALLSLSSPTAFAVTPTSATASFDCGSWGSGLATLTAADNGTTKSIKLTSSAITMPSGSSADPNSITATLKVVKSGGGVVEFSATANPGMTYPNPITLGPLKITSGTLAAGDTTNLAVLTPPASATNNTLKIVTSSPTVATVYCVATSVQSSAFTW